VLVTGAIRDITERKRAKENLRELSAQLPQLQDEERRRIASAGQMLAALSMKLTPLADDSKSSPHCVSSCLSQG